MLPPCSICGRVIRVPRGIVARQREDRCAYLAGQLHELQIEPIDGMCLRCLNGLAQYAVIHRIRGEWVLPAFCARLLLSKNRKWTRFQAKDRQCPQCGTAFLPERTDRKYCSPECVQIAGKGVSRKERPCKNCGQLFVRKRKKTRSVSCSKECADILRHQNAERQKALSLEKQQKHIAAGGVVYEYEYDGEIKRKYSFPRSGVRHNPVKPGCGQA